MRKFLAVVKHEYRKVVLKWSFVIGTLLMPFLAAMFAVVPAIIFSIKGEPTRIVVVDAGGHIASRLRGNLSAEKLMEKARKAAQESTIQLDASQEGRLKQNAQQLVENFIFVDYPADTTDLNKVHRELNGKILDGEIDAYLIVPPEVGSRESKFEFRSRKAGDFITNDTFKDALNDAVRSERLSAANISEEKLSELNAPVNMDLKGIDERGQEQDSDSVMIASFLIGLMIYITLAIYGQAIMGAVVEEKETRIAEILFSSARPFELMLGKLVGVGFAGLTQLAIWVVSAAVVLAVLATQTDASMVFGSIPPITPLMIVYFLIYFFIGFFIYASIFALIGSMVTTVQEGSQFAFPPVLIMLIGFYFSFAIVRDPNSSLSFWVSLAPFFAPITMPVRILAHTPPIWQILLSIAINGLAIAGLVWLAARVYRVGMLMYGKRATLGEVWKWVRMS